MARQKKNNLLSSGAPRKEPKQRRAQATVDAIIDGTIRIIRRDGYQGLTTNAIADAAGVSIGSIYQYFPDKDAIVLAMIKRLQAEQAQRLLETLSKLGDRSVREGVEAAIRVILDYPMSQPEFAAALYDQLARIGKLAEIFAHIERTTTQPLRAYLQTRRDELAITDFDFAAFLLINTVQPFIQRASQTKRTFEKETFVRELTRMVMAYLTTPL